VATVPPASGEVLRWRLRRRRTTYPCREGRSVDKKSGGGCLSAASSPVLKAGNSRAFSCSARSAPGQIFFVVRPERSEPVACQRECVAHQHECVGPWRHRTGQPRLHAT